jgi:hypothetical protein
MRQLLFTLLLIQFAFQSRAQDTLVLQSGSPLLVTVKNVESYVVTYTDFGSNDTAIKRLPVSVISEIRFLTGMKQIFNKSAGDELSPETLRLRARADAEEHYKKYKGARWGAAGSAFMGGAILGLIPTIAISTTTPKPSRLDIPDPKMAQNPVYREAYRNQAKRIKSRKTWGGYGLGILAYVGMAIIVASATSGGN